MPTLKATPSLVSQDRPRPSPSSRLDPTNMRLAVDRAPVDPAILRWMPLAVPMAAALLCACTLVVWMIA